MPSLSREERLTRARANIAEAKAEIDNMPTGRARTYSVARTRKWLRAATQVLRTLTRLRTGTSRDVQEIVDEIDTLWPRSKA